MLSMSTWYFNVSELSEWHVCEKIWLGTDWKNNIQKGNVWCDNVFRPKFVEIILQLARRCCQKCLKKQVKVTCIVYPITDLNDLRKYRPKTSPVVGGSYKEVFNGNDDVAVFEIIFISMFSGIDSMAIDDHRVRRRLCTPVLYVRVQHAQVHNIEFHYQLVITNVYMFF